MWWTESWHAPWMWFGPLGLLLVAIACIALVLYCMRGGAHDARALEILRERYARGDISQAEFEERRRLLQS